MLAILWAVIFFSQAWAQVVLDESCLKDPKFKGKTQQELEATLKHNLELAEKSIFWCEFKYPQIKRYTGEWRQVRRSFTLGCEEDHPNTGAYFAFKHPFATQNRIFLTSDGAKEILLKKYPEADDKIVSLLVHEIFHGTSADIFNPFRHNRIERIPSQDSCTSDDVTKDRVSVLESLCTGATLNSSPRSAGHEILKKIRRCGLKKGCMELFTQDRGLAEAQAREVCEAIQAKATCEMLNPGPDPVYLTDQQKLSFLSQSKILFEGLAFLRESADHLPTSLRLPMQFIEKNPGIREGLNAIKKSTCFQHHFKVDQDGVVCKSASKGIHGCLPIRRIEGLCTRAGLDGIEAWIRSNYSVKSGFSEMSALFDDLQSFAKQNSYPDYDDLEKVLSDQRIKRLLGEGNVSRMLKLLRQYAPEKEDRSCSQVDVREMEALMRVLDTVKSPPQTDCNFSIFR